MDYQKELARMIEEARKSHEKHLAQKVKQEAWSRQLVATINVMQAMNSVFVMTLFAGVCNGTK